jgi:predicted GH43/DUF377 family glycosyl hydrolase
MTTRLRTPAGPLGLALLGGLCWLVPVPPVTRAAPPSRTGSQVVVADRVTSYADGRPSPRYRLEAKDHGVVLRHGQAPERCDILGARDIWVWADGGKFYMHYDGSGPKGWLACLATSDDLIHWTTKGPALELGAPGRPDSASASYGTVFRDGDRWHMFYLGTPNVTPAPDFIPAFPYLTMKAEGPSPTGPWTKRYDITPFKSTPGTYYAGASSPGFVLKHGGEYLMSFAASTDYATILRTLSFARTRNLDGPWTPDPKPFLPATEQVENSSFYFEPTCQTWFVFTNHVGLRDGLEYTDAVWVYWTQDLERWDPAHKAVVLDTRNCTWSKHIIGLPSVVQSGNRLAIFYDGNSAPTIPPGVKSHMDRDIGLAWLELPLVPPKP